MNAKSVMFMLDPFILPRLEGIASYAREHGWKLFTEDRVGDDSDLRLFDGAICSLRGKRHQLNRVRTLRALGRPVVDLTMECRTVPLPHVSSDHEECGRLAATHLMSIGIENFAWFASARSNVQFVRYRGFAKQLGRKPVKIDLSTLRDRLMKLPKPLGVAAYSETDAGLVLDECARLSLGVPEDVAVIAIGNDPFLCENRSITISSVDTNMSVAAYEAARLLDDLMRNRRQPGASREFVKLIPPCGVVSRSSTDTLAHKDPFIRDVLVDIHRNLSTCFGAAEIADRFKIARKTLDRRFHAAVGHSIGREIVEQRIKLAKRLLRNEDMPLKEIACECGFCNQAFLTTIFKRETGLTPSRWRQSESQADIA